MHCVSVYDFYVFDNLSLIFDIAYIASLALVFVVANFQYLCVGKFRIFFFYKIILLKRDCFMQNDINQPKNYKQKQKI